MADADKAEVPGAAGHDSPLAQPAEPPGEARREAHPPEAEKQPPQHSSGSNGVKMYCLFLRGPGRGGDGKSAGGGGTAWASGGTALGRGARAEQVQPGCSQARASRSGRGERGAGAGGRVPFAAGGHGSAPPPRLRPESRPAKPGGRRGLLGNGPAFKGQ